VWDISSSRHKEAAMGKNILIFSDGTGNRGGLLVDERRSNVYKLYRATRCGPDSYVDALQQVAFYDPGLGTLPAGMDSVWSVIRTVYNCASQATGLGLTRNIIDCYAEIIRLYRPGDRIYLFGFSRGAYTVRCLAGVLRWCGVPTRAPSGERYGFDEKSAKKVAREGVKKVYQHRLTKVTKSLRESRRYRKLAEMYWALALGEKPESVQFSKIIKTIRT
jgi:hypothetical protein